MPVRSSQAAEKAIYDGDFIEGTASVAGETLTQCRSTLANIGDASFVHGNAKSTTKDALTTSGQSTRTCRNELVDGKPLLKKQRAAVWSRPSMAAHKTLLPPWYDGNVERSSNSVSSLSFGSLEEVEYIMAPLSREESCDSSQEWNVGHDEEKDDSIDANPHIDKEDRPVKSTTLQER
jgi:hypothetical protein